MVARIVFGKELGKAIRYNERKVQDNKASCLEAAGIGWNDSRLSALAKERFFAGLTSRNQLTVYNAVHISLNFHPSEKEYLTDDLMREIATKYLDKIGFGDQPFLLYRHEDTHHPHLHIVTTNIQYDGSRIDTQWLYQRKSEPARKTLETEYGLIRAAGRALDSLLPLPALDSEVIQYGKSETKAAISNIVREVVRTYQFSSISELNTILEQFNVYLDEGELGSTIQQYGGLVYGLLNAQGQKIGVPIKASSIYTKPTKAALEQKYAGKKAQKAKYRGRLIRVVEDAMSASTGKEHFEKMLEAAKVSVKFHTNEKQQVYGITFIDNLTRCVFKGSDLKKHFNGAAILKRITAVNNPQAQYNFLFVQQLLEHTDFSQRAASVLRRWNKNGLSLIRIPGVPVSKYYAGHSSLPPETFVQLPQAVAGWLDDHLQAAQQKAQHGRSHSMLFDSGFLQTGPTYFEKMFGKIGQAHAALFDPPYAPYTSARELLAEAKKKKRKKRRS